MKDIRAAIAAAQEQRDNYGRKTLLFVDENYMPQEMGNKQYYFPTDRGLEVKIGEKLNHLRSLDK